MNQNLCVTLATLCFAIFALPGCFHEERQVVTVYDYTCYETGAGFYHTKSYAVYPLRQEVVSEDLSRHTACAIYDKDNWLCRYSDGSGYVSVRNGDEFFDNRAEYPRSKSVTVSVGKLAYWLHFIMTENPPGASMCRTTLAYEKAELEKSKLPIEKR